MGILLSDIFDPGSIRLDIESADKEAAFAELVDALAARRLPDFDPAEALAAIVARENRMSTGIAPGVGIPHAFYGKADGIVGAIGVSRAGVEYDALDGKPVYAIFMLLIGENAKGEHLPALNQICALAQSEGLALLRDAKTPRDVGAILSRFG